MRFDYGLVVFLHDVYGEAGVDLGAEGGHMKVIVQ